MKLLFHFLRPHLREEQHILNRRLVGHEHRQTVDSHSETGCRRHTVFEGTDKIHVDVHSLVVTLLVLEACLLLEAIELVDRVVKFAVGIGKLLSTDKEFEALGKFRIFAVTLCER